MYNNPYLYNNYFPYQNMSINSLEKKGILTSLTNNMKRINWSNILTNTQKTLNVINQAIPVYYQMKPLYNNAKTMFRMVNALKDNDTTNSTISSDNKTSNEKNTNPNGPVFFL